MNKNDSKVIMVGTTTVCQCMFLCLFSIISYIASGTAAYAFNLCVPFDGVVWSMGIIPALGTVGVVLIGIGAMHGKLQWQTAVMCAIGVFLMANYGNIIVWFNGPGGC